MTPEIVSCPGKRHSVSPDLVDELLDRVNELAELLTCSCCYTSDRRLVESYWGPRFCPPCVAEIVEQFDTNHSWPPVDWESEVTGESL